MFVIDVSATAVQSGAVQIAVQTIREQLDNLPGAPRTRVGFVTYDSSIHFYNLKVLSLWLLSVALRIMTTHCSLLICFDIAVDVEGSTNDGDR